MKAARLQEALEILESKYGLHFLMDGKNVTLKYVPAPPPAPIPGSQKIDGVIVDDNGQGRSRRNDTCGVLNYSMTNERGGYSIMVMPGTQLLEVSLIGYNTENVTAKGASPNTGQISRIERVE